MKAAEGFTYNQSDHNHYTLATNHVNGISPQILTEIYREDIMLAVFERTLAPEISHYCEQLTQEKPNLNLRSAIKVAYAKQALQSTLPNLAGQPEFIEDLSTLIEMYACLFDLTEVGLRMQILDRAMCPRFHMDNIGCRLITTYQGGGTEWLNNVDIDRSKLGAGNMGLPDTESGLFPNTDCIQQVNVGDVVLLKGDGWIGNEGLGAVHRSPAVPAGEQRVVVTMDFA